MIPLEVSGIKQIDMVGLDDKNEVTVLVVARYNMPCSICKLAKIHKRSKPTAQYIAIVPVLDFSSPAKTCMAISNR